MVRRLSKFEMFKPRPSSQNSSVLAGHQVESETIPIQRGQKEGRTAARGLQVCVLNEGSCLQLARS